MKPSTLTLGLVVTALSACGSGSLGTSGTAGSAGGAAGTAGAGATGGSVIVGIAGAGGATAGAGGATAGTGGSVGGTGGTLPACGNNTSGASDVVEAVIMGADGMPVVAPVTAAVSITAIQSCLNLDCPSPATSAATRIALAGADPQQWTLYLRNTAMPPDIIKVGDTFDLTIDAAVDQTLYRTTNQTIVLARDNDVIVFAASLQQFHQPPLPNLLPFGIAVTDAGASCQNPASFGCIDRPHTARIAIGSDASVLVAGGQTGRIGGLQITDGQFTELADAGNCDRKSSTVMAGFRLP
jgi:hypothetical protein